MAYLRSKNTAVLFKLESAEGEDASPSASTDAILCENFKFGYNAKEIATNEYNGSLDGAGPLISGMTIDVSWDVYLKGSGAAATPPEFGDILKACGWAEVITSSAIPSSAEACASGGSTTMAVLGSSAAATVDLYRGMPINFTGLAAGNSFISDYTASKHATLTDVMGAAIVATTNYQIPANVLYKPASINIPSGTIYAYEDGILSKFFGWRGSMSLNLAAGEMGKITFTGKAMYGGESDVAVPTVVTDATRPPIYKGGKFLINRTAAAISQFNIDAKMDIVNPEDPNLAEGFDAAQITGRDMRGTMNPARTLVATNDVITQYRNNENQILHARYGLTAGNRVGLVVPKSLYTKPDKSDRGGIQTRDISFACIGRDAGAFLCFY